MRKISVVLPVYNEEFFINACISNIYECADEIIVIDGSPNGKSTDNTVEIVKSFGKKIVYKTGTFKTDNGGWDSASQKNVGISESSGNIVMFLSADMFFDQPERLFDILRNDEQHKVFFLPTIEFWLDMTRVRLYSDSTLLSIPSTVFEVVAIDKSLKPVFDGKLRCSETSLDERLLIQDMTKYHLGWIRPFDHQVAKHIRHVRSGAWGKHGQGLLEGGEQKLTQWAITHVMTYKQVGSVACNVNVPECLKGFDKLNYNTNMESVIEAYKEKYGSSPFRG